MYIIKEVRRMEREVSEISHAQHKWHRTCKKRFQDDKNESEERGAAGIHTENQIISIQTN